MGSSICETTIVDMGKMETKSVIRQSHGTKLAVAMMIIMTINIKQNDMDHLNCWRTRVSEKNLVWARRERSSNGWGHTSLSEDLRHLREKIRELKFFAGCAPDHIDLEHVRQ